MTPASSGAVSGPRPRRRTLAVIVVVVLVLVGAALAVGPPRPGEAYDPGNVGPLGLAALVELLEGMDVEVEVSSSPPTDISTSLFIPTDRLSDRARSDVAGWIEDGGTAIVAGSSPLHGLGLLAGPLEDMFGATPRAPMCDAGALARVGVVEHAGWESLEIDEDAVHACFPVGQDAAHLVMRRDGAGTVIALGSPEAFINANLDRADNAVLAAAVLAPAAGDRVVVMPPAAVGEGETEVLDLVPSGFWRLLLLGTVAIVLGIVWSARRLGRPVEERLPPVLPSAELAHSIAGLLQRSGDRGTAAQRLRADARRRVERALGLPSGTDPSELGSLVAHRLGVDHRAAQRALIDDEVRDDDALFDVATACSELHGALRAPTSGSRSEPRTVDQADDD